MDDKSKRPPDVGPEMTRRVAINSLLGASSMPWLTTAGSAQGTDDPPVFATARYQFTMIEPAMTMPAVILQDMMGRPKRLVAVSGRILLVNIWATWCAACQIDLPLLERFHHTVGDRIMVAAVSIDGSEQRGRVKRYLEMLAIRSLPIYLDQDQKLAHPPAGATSPFSLAEGMPVTYLVAPSGRVAGYILGVADWLSVDAQRLLVYYANG